MGSWNKTCGLTHMSILEGEEVIVYPLVQAPNYRDRCYNTAFWKPFLLGAECVYADYGEGGEHKDQNIELFLDTIRHDIAEKPQGENPYHDTAVSIADATTPEWFYDIIHKGRLSIQGQSDVDFVMIKKSAVLHFAENFVFEEYVGDGKGIGGYGNCYNYYKFADVLQKIPEVIQRIKNTQVTDNVFLKMSLPHRGLEGLYDYCEEGMVRSFLGTSDYRKHGGWQICEIIAKASVEDEEKCAKLLYALMLGNFVDTMIDCLRKQWMPGCHEGSQNTDMQAYEVLATSIENENIIRRERWGDYDE